MNININLNSINKTDPALKKWENELEIIEQKRQQLKISNPKNYKELKEADSLGRTIIDCVSTMDDYIEQKEVAVDTIAQQAAKGFTALGLAVGSILSVSLLGVLKTLKIKNIKKLSVPFLISGAALGTVFGTSLGTIWSVNTHKKATKIAKSEAMHNLSEDPRSFVVHTQEQINKAELLSNNIILDPTEDNNPYNPVIGVIESFKTVADLVSTDKAPREWFGFTAVNNIDNNCNDIVKDKKQRAILSRIIGRVERYSNEYSQKVAMATNIIAVTGFTGGYLGGQAVKGATVLMQKLSFISKNSSVASFSKKTASPILSLGIGLSSLYLSYTLQNKASSVGRFKAKQDLIKDPYNFTYYSDKELNKVKLTESKEINTGTKNKLFSSLVDQIKFLFKVNKDFKEYDNYMEKDFKHELKVRQALKSADLSDKQLANAKNLRENAFKVFNKTNETTLEYVEKVETARNIGRNTLISLFSIPAMIVVAKEISKIPQLFDFNTGNYKKVISKLGNEGLKISSELALIIALPLTIYEIIATKVEKDATNTAIMTALNDLEEPIEPDPDPNKEISIKKTQPFMDIQEFLKSIKS